jgi:DNA-binding MurR/RpiR family transcriptional regulator
MVCEMPLTLAAENSEIMTNKISKDDVIQHIRQQHENLSPSQRKVAEYLLQGGIDVLHYTIARIAEAVDVNASTVVRTAQSLGFDGFPELQSALRRQFLHQTRVSQRIEISSKQLIDDLRKEEDSQSHILTTVLRDEVQLLLDLPQHVPPVIFDKAVDMLDEANQIFIIGLGASFPVALNFGILLRYVRPNTTVLTPGIDPIPAQLAALVADDLIFSICFARYTRETLTTMEYAKRKNAKVITVTDSDLSPAAKRADLSLVMPYRLRLYGNSIGPFALLDALLGALSLRYPEATQQRLDTLEELYEAFNLLSRPDE